MSKQTKIIVGALSLAFAIGLAFAGLGFMCSPTPIASTADGVSGIGSSFVSVMKVIGICMIVAAVAVTSIPVIWSAKSLAGLGAGLAEWMQSTVVGIAAALKPAPPMLDTVLVEKGGKTYKIRDILEDIKGLKNHVSSIDSRTAHIEPPPPPPPPKSAEEIVAEQAAMLADLQRQLALMQKQSTAPAPKPAAVVVAPAVKPVETAQ